MLYSTLCYLERGDEYLMLHRVKKDHDVNQGKWIDRKSVVWERV